MIPQDGYSQCLYDILSDFDIKLLGKTPDFSTEEINSHLVRINAQVGITEDDAKRVIDMVI
jgi:hypothetical protein